MQREEALQHLPEVHRSVLVWLDDGEDDSAIAARLSIDPVAVAPLVAIARGKLNRLLDE